MTRGARARVVLTIAAVLGGCSSNPPAPDWQRSLVSELRRNCIARAGGPSMDAVDLLAGRLHTACAQWAYREARQLMPR